MSGCIESCNNNPHFLLFLFGGIFVFSIICGIISYSRKHQGVHFSVEIQQRNPDDNREEDLRCVDGHLCRTDTDRHKWNIINTMAREMHYRLRRIELLLSDPATENGDTLYTEWKSRYDSYRAICVKYGMWNYQLEDYKTFIPTYPQAVAENTLKSRIDNLYTNWVQEHHQYVEENDLILNYLRMCPRHHAIKSDMVYDLSGGDSEEKKRIYRIYNRMKRKGLIADKQIAGTKQFETRIVTRREKEIQTVSIAPSSFNKELYSNLDQFDLFKVQNTVGEPSNVDRVKNTCTFESMANGEIYYTSLNMCSCPSFQNNGRCKHMIALAMYLGYLKKKDFH